MRDFEALGLSELGMILLSWHALMMMALSVTVLKTTIAVSLR